MVNARIIIETLAKMEKYFGRTLDPDIRLMYVDRLKNLDEITFRNASVLIMDTFQQTSTKPFPLIADFLEVCGEDGKTRAINIMSAVRRACMIGQYYSVDFQDPALHSVIERYGGWPEIVCNDYDEWWSLHERNFIAAYESARRAGLKGPSHLPGLQEITSKRDGFGYQKPIKVSAKTGETLSMPEKVNPWTKVPESEEKLLPKKGQGLIPRPEGACAREG